MPSTLKDAFSEATAGTRSANNEPQGAQPGIAAGAEIPVTVHASRYSAAAKGAGKLPAVHEETRTVIILPQGAVVRLSATVTPGELVVLTNNRTGADVICRVTDIKTQPGIQNYVHLEFTQRALDFWEEASTARSADTRAKSPVITTPATVPPMPVATAGRNTPAQEIQPAAAKIPMSAVEVKSASASAKVTPLADLPTAAIAETHVPFSLGQSPVSEPVPASAAVPKPSAAPVLRSPRLQPYEPLISQSKTNSKTVVLFAIAAVVLLGIGVVAGSVLLRQDRPPVSQQLWNPLQPAPAAPSPSVASSEPAPSEAPVVNTSGRVNSHELPASSPVGSPLPEKPLAPAAAAPAVETAIPEVQPQPLSRSKINVGKIPAPRPKAAQANSSEPPPVLPAMSNTIPGLIDNAGNTMARPNPLLPVVPAAPAPVKGGQLQQPRLLSSVAPVYPSLARAQHVQGDVVVDALIDATGKVAATSVISGNSLLQKAALDALRLSKYEPARLNGEPIPIHINVTIVFHLN